MQSNSKIKLHSNEITKLLLGAEFFTETKKLAIEQARKIRKGSSSDKIYIYHGYKRKRAGWTITIVPKWQTFRHAKYEKLVMISKGEIIN